MPVTPEQLAQISAAMGNIGASLEQVSALLRETSTATGTATSATKKAQSTYIGFNNALHNAAKLLVAEKLGLQGAADAHIKNQNAINAELQKLKILHDTDNVFTKGKKEQVKIFKLYAAQQKAIYKEEQKQLQKLTGEYKSGARKALELGAAKIKAAAGFTTFSAGIKNLLSITTSYNKSLFSVSRTSQVFGRGIADMDSALKTVTKNTVISKQAFIGMVDSFNRGYIGAAKSATEIAKLGKTLQAAFGPNVDEIKARLQDLQGIFNKFPALGKMVEKAGEMAQFDGDPKELREYQAMIFSIANGMGLSSEEMDTIAKMTTKATAEQKKLQETQELIAKGQQIWANMMLKASEYLNKLVQKANEWLQGHEKILAMGKGILSFIEEYGVQIAIITAGVWGIHKAWKAVEGVMLAAQAIKMLAGGAGPGGTGGGVKGGLAAAFTQRGSSPINPLFVSEVGKITNPAAKSTNKLLQGIKNFLSPKGNLQALQGRGGMISRIGGTSRMATGIRGGFAAYGAYAVADFGRAAFSSKYRKKAFDSMEKGGYMENVGAGLKAPGAAIMKFARDGTALVATWTGLTKEQRAGKTLDKSNNAKLKANLERGKSAAFADKGEQFTKYFEEKKSKLKPSGDENQDLIEQIKIIQQFAKEQGKVKDAQAEITRETKKTEKQQANWNDTLSKSSGFALLSKEIAEAKKNLEAMTGLFSTFDGNMNGLISSLTEMNVASAQMLSPMFASLEQLRKKMISNIGDLRKELFKEGGLASMNIEELFGINTKDFEKEFGKSAKDLQDLSDVEYAKIFPSIIRVLTESADKNPPAVSKQKLLEMIGMDNANINDVMAEIADGGDKLEKAQLTALQFKLNKRLTATEEKKDEFNKDDGEKRIADLQEREAAMKRIAELRKKEGEVRLKVSGGDDSDETQKELEDITDEIDAQSAKVKTLTADYKAVLDAMKAAKVVAEQAGKVADKETARQTQINELVKQRGDTEKQNALLGKQTRDQISGIVDQQQEYNRIIESRLQSERDLMEAAQFGMGASIEMMQKQIVLQEHMIDLEQQAIDMSGEKIALALKDAKVSASQLPILKEKLINAESSVDRANILNNAGIADTGIQSRINAALEERSKHMQKQMEAQKKIYDITKEMREGYLDAIREMSVGAGEFEKIIGTQEMGVTQLMKSVNSFTDSGNQNMLNTMKLGGMQSSDQTAAGVGTGLTGLNTTMGARFEGKEATEAKNKRIFGYKENMDRYKQMQRGDTTSIVGTGVAGQTTDDTASAVRDGTFDGTKEGMKEALKESGVIMVGNRGSPNGSYNGINPALLGTGSAFRSSPNPEKNDPNSRVAFSVGVANAAQSGGRADPSPFIGPPSAMREQKAIAAKQIVELRESLDSQATKIATTLQAQGVGLAGQRDFLGANNSDDAMRKLTQVHDPEVKKQLVAMLGNVKEGVATEKKMQKQLNEMGAVAQESLQTTQAQTDKLPTGGLAAASREWNPNAVQADGSANPLAMGNAMMMMSPEEIYQRKRSGISDKRDYYASELKSSSNKTKDIRDQILSTLAGPVGEAGKDVSLDDLVKHQDKKIGMTPLFAKLSESAYAEKNGKKGESFDSLITSHVMGAGREKDVMSLDELTQIEDLKSKLKPQFDAMASEWAKQGDLRMKQQGAQTEYENMPEKMRRSYSKDEMMSPDSKVGSLEQNGEAGMDEALDFMSKSRFKRQDFDAKTKDAEKKKAKAREIIKKVESLHARKTKIEMDKSSKTGVKKTEETFMQWQDRIQTEDPRAYSQIKEAQSLDAEANDTMASLPKSKFGLLDANGNLANVDPKKLTDDEREQAQAIRDHIGDVKPVKGENMQDTILKRGYKEMVTSKDADGKPVWESMSDEEQFEKQRILQAASQMEKTKKDAKQSKSAGASFEQKGAGASGKSYASEAERKGLVADEAAQAKWAETYSENGSSQISGISGGDVGQGGGTATIIIKLEGNLAGDIEQMKGVTVQIAQAASSKSAK